MFTFPHFIDFYINSIFFRILHVLCAGVLEFPLPNPGSVIVLMSGDGLQVTVPAVLLLSFSQLVRNLLIDHLPPAFSPPAISSLPAVLRMTLQLVRLLCSAKGGFVGEV